MSALLYAAASLLLVPVAHAQWVDHPVLDPTPTSAAGFSIATAPNEPPAVNMDGVVYDAFPSHTTTAEAVAVAISTGAAKVTAVAASAASAVASGPPKGDNDDKGECRLLGSFALFVQLALGGLALMSLVYKRWRERPQRPIKIWFFDASKQVFGSVLVHVANVFMSMMTSGRFSIKVEPAAVGTAAVMLKRFAGSGEDDGEYVPNPCSFYLLNLAIDTTLGIPILILLLRIFTGLAGYTSFGQPPESIQSGNYGNPPNAWWWLKQSLIYFCGLFGMKFCVLVIFVMLPWISRVGDWALGWTEGNEKIQIVFVMMLFPLIMNALQYYIIDSFIKKQASKEDTEGHSRPGSEVGSYQRVPDGSSEAGEDSHHQQHRTPSVEADQNAKATMGSQIKKSASPVHQEYDPEVDGDGTAVREGSSTTGPEGNVPEELYPKE